MTVVALLAIGFQVRAAFQPDCGFDRDEWAAAMKVGDLFERYERTDELAERLVDCGQLLDRRPRRAVLEMLGPPHYHARGRVWSWNIGQPEDRSEYFTLDVTFGREGRVRKVR